MADRPKAAGEVCDPSGYRWMDIHGADGATPRAAERAKPQAATVAQTQALDRLIL